MATRSYVNLIKRAQQQSYQVTLMFFWLNSMELAVERVALRVQEGGHSIPEDIIRRRYENGLRNFFTLYQPVVDIWILVDNSGQSYQLIAEGTQKSVSIVKEKVWEMLYDQYYG